VIHRDDPAKQFDHDLDRLVENPGRGIEAGGNSSELFRAAAVTHARDATDPEADPRPAFLSRLENQLAMNASDAVLPFMTVPNALAPSRDQHSRNEVRTKRRFSLSLRHPAIGGVATAALLIVTMLGAYLAFIAPGGGRNGTPTVPAVQPGASPSPEMNWTNKCDRGPYYDCINYLDFAGSGYISRSALSGPAREAREVQLQDWVISPGTEVATVADSVHASGVVVDFVLTGAYVASFNASVVVSRAWTSGGGATIEQPNPGTTVELGRGDTVTYEVGELTEVRNPLSVQPLQFKRAVIYKGDINSWIGTTSSGVTTRVEGNATLPQTIGSYELDPTANLWYIQVAPGPSFPPTQWEDDTTIGPVDPQQGLGDGSEGFILVIEPAKG
jgi:hypothetical protein